MPDEAGGIERALTGAERASFLSERVSNRKRPQHPWRAMLGPIRIAEPLLTETSGPLLGLEK